MNKTAQNLTWNCLPLEVKKEVKRQYQIAINAKEYYTECTLEYLFGIHNLTSDAEGEDDELLYVSRKRVQDLYEAMLSEQERKDLELYNQVSAEDRAAMLFGLFGSKCLPDEEPKPAEPKYKRGDNVMYDGTVQTIVSENIRCGREYYLSGVEYPVAESDLEPYTEPKEKNHIAQDLEMVDNIIKDGFSKEHRLNIAAQLTCAMLPKYQDDGNGHGLSVLNEKDMIKCAYRLADALITESEKGGSK